MRWVEALESRQLLSTAPLQPSHVVIVMEEDRFANAIGDTVNMPYTNQLASSGLLLAHLQALNTTSQGGEMNYLGLYSGSAQGVTSNPPDASFSGANIAKSLNSTGSLSFAGFAESLPADGSQVTTAAEVGGYKIPDLYTRTYNPMAMFSNAGPGVTNAQVNRTFADFQSIAASSGSYANLPTVSLVVPNNLDNTHGSDSSTLWAGDPSYYNFFRQSADTWLKQNMGPYVSWAKTHNSVLIVLGDEGDRAHTFANGTEAIVAGDPKLVVPGTVSTQVNVYTILRSVEDMYHLTPLGNTATIAGIATNSLGQLQAPDTKAPTAPGTPVLTAATETTATIAWAPSTDNVGVIGYNVYRNGALAGSISGTSTSFTDQGLKVNTSYTYTVVALDAYLNKSVASGALTLTTPDLTPPTVPGTVTLSASTATSVTIAWTASTDNVGVAGYNIYRGGVLIGSTASGITKYADAGLTPNSYSYTVAAFDAAKNLSAQSAPLIVSLGAADSTPPTAPGAPTLVNATDTTATITWPASTDNVGVAGYNIYRNGTLAGSVNGSTTSFADKGLTANTTYAYTVVAFDASQNKSVASGALTVTTPDLTPPTTPGMPTLSASTATSVTIAWTASTDNVGVAGYDIYRGGVLIGSTTAGITTYTDGGLAANSYAYTVAAFDAAKNLSAQSAALNVVVGAADSTPPTAPGTPTLVNATETTATITWTASTDNVGVAGYDIYRNGILAGVVSGTATTFGDAGLTVNTSYSYTVAAFDAQNNLSAQSAALSVRTPDLTPPAAPTGLMLVSATATTIKLSWTAATDNVGVQGYDIYRNGVDINWVGAGATTFTDASGLAPSTSYTYQIVAWDGAYNISAKSAALSASTTA